MSNPQEMFQHECAELLTAMEDALLKLEEDPNDADQINEMFRSMHTIKGTAGVFSYDDVVAFTHVVESVLDQVRNREINITSDLVALMLRCMDHTKLLVELAISENTIDAQDQASGDAMINELNAYLGDKAGGDSTDMEETEANEQDQTDSGEVVGWDNWHISLRFEDTVLQDGMDPLSFIRYLKKLGEIVNVTTIYDNLPLDENFNPENNYLGFEIDLASDADKKQIEQTFEFVREMCQLHILPPRAKISHYANLIQQLPEENMRVGEILVASGVITQNELESALNEQIAKKNSAEKNENQPPLGEVLVENKSIHQEVLDVALEKQAKTQSNRAATQRVLRVDAEKLDALINLVGELVIAGATTNMLAEQLADEKLLESMSSVSRLVEEIRDNALNLRMVQIGETFNRFKRVVRDVSVELGKDIQLEITGAETELDKTVVEKIADPLMHLVRNAMDHGIESSEERVAAGKSAQGNLSLNAYHDSGYIVIEVSDDGKGLDRDKILAKAMEKNIITDGAVITDNEVYRLIFEAGFSTAEQVTNLSGRGVGMDVVKRNIEALRGTVDIESKTGEGSTVSIRLPLTLAIIDGFLVKVGESSYVIPLDMVIECIDLTDTGKEDENAQGYINLRGEVLPYIKLRDYFQEQGPESGHKSIVVVQQGNQKAGFVVDALLGELQTVIKPMGKILKNLKGISGATILGSGEVAVILDVPNLIQRATKIVHMESTTMPNPNNLTLH